MPALFQSRSANLQQVPVINVFFGGSKGRNASTPLYSRLSCFQGICLGFYNDVETDVLAHAVFLDGKSYFNKIAF